MATMYVGGGLYLPTTGTASKTSTPTGGTVTVAQRNAIASATKPATTTAAKKPTTNTLSSMAGSSLGTTSRPASSPTASLVSGSSSSSSSSRNTAAQNAAVASLLSGAGTGGINAVRRSANPVNVVGYRPPPVGSSTHGMIFNSPGNYPPTSFQSLQNAASSLAAIQAAQRERDARAAKTSVPASYDYLFGARNDDKPYVSAYDVARYGSMNSGPGLLPSKEFGGYLGARPEAKLASILLAGGAGALDAVVSPAYGLGTGLLDYLSGGTPDDFMNSYAGGYGDANAIFQPYKTLDPLMYGKGANAGLVAATAYGMPGVMGPTRAAAEAAAAAALARRAPRAVAGIDAAPLTPRQAQFRELMDNLNANPANAAVAPRPVSTGPRIPQGGISPTPAAVSPAEIARLENILGNLGYSAPRAATPAVPPSVARLPADDLDALLSRAVEKGPGAPGPLSAEAGAAAYRNARQKLVNDELSSLQGSQLFSDVPPMATAPGPLSAEAGAAAYRNARQKFVNDELSSLQGSQLFSDVPPIATTPAATGRNAFMDVLDAIEAAKAAKVGNAEKAGPYVAVSADEAANIIRRPGAQTVYPPGFMSADEAANVLRPGPRVAADAGRMDPFTKNALITAAVGTGVGSLLANGQLGPAPTATTPQPVAVPDEQRGIDAARAPVSNETLNAFANSRGNMSLRLPGGEDQVLIPTEDGTIILPAPEDVAPAVEPSRGSIYPAWVSKAKGDAYNEANPEVADSVAVDNSPIDSGAPASGEQGEDTAAPAAGTKFTPGPGQFVGTNGYIYEQSSDGSFEQVGRVPGYTPAQLSEAANKGAFRDPNNIVTGGAKPRKQARKKGERTFFDDAGDFLKERVDDSVYGKLSKLFFPDDAAAAEAAATGPEAVEYYSTPPSSVPESLISSSGSSKKRKKKDEDETDGGTGGTGTGGTGTSPYTPEVQAMLNALYGNYMRQYNGPGVGYVPGVDPERNYFTPAFADGGLVDGRLVLGDGGSKEDKIPATIDGVERAKLSNGEFVMTAAAVKNAGGGDIELGAKRLMDLNNMLSYGRPAERLKVQHVK